ncbi:ABC transporter substrate-binding protein [Pseudonocardia acaciae]|uniref:ABC transporter substrate-binding protein n=1 Tax=Pseudonocardia acaciae TaxID=551276 RepID=UPI00048DD0FA|nr:ABC transporter substrate-binding protein [Pseudonocardia acaciae]
MDAGEVLDVDLVNPPDRGRPPAVTEEDVQRVRYLLTRLSLQLGADRERRRPITRFRRFALVDWLMDLPLEPNLIDQEGRKREIRAALRRRYRYEPSNIPNDLGVPGWVRTTAIAALGLLFRARISGRVPLLSGYYRWFVRRHSLAPGRVGSMPSVATALTEREWPSEPEQTLLFMVNSFMEDIRAAYRNPLKCFLGIRRTSCCLLTISNITRRNGGYHLLRAINEVRNASGLTDPLLVVTESQRVPPFAEPPDGIAPVSDAWAAYLDWTLQGDPTQAARAWYLPLRVPPTPNDPEQRRRLDRLLRAAPWLEAPPDPPLARAARIGSAALVVAAGAYSYAWWSQAHCGNGLSWPGLRPTVSWVGSECVGVSADLTVLFSPLGPETERLARDVATLNAEVDDRQDEQPTRPVITLAYLGALSAPGPNTGALTAEIEGLKGVAVAQRRALDSTASTDPLVKVIMANAGQRMASGHLVADIIGGLARKDPTLVGVVGLNESYRETASTVNALAGHGIPTVAATVSTDSFARDLPMYFQIAPQNRREAAVAAAYASAHTGPGQERSVRIYFSDNTSDVYSSNLAEDAREAFKAVGFDVTTISFTPDGNDPPAAAAPADRHVVNAGAAGADSCGYRGVAFYAARPMPDFGSFLATAKNCQPFQPRILAADDTTRYVANDQARELYPSIAFDYLAFAVTLPSQAAATPEQDFYNSYGRLFPALPGAGESLDGHAALAYDAAETFIASARQLSSRPQPVPISPGTVAGRISSITAPGLRGASGYIDFGGEVDRHVPVDKAVMVLRVRGGKVEQESKMNYCGPPKPMEPRTLDWCPHETPKPR